jgi:hypothetical protein
MDGLKELIQIIEDTRNNLRIYSISFEDLVVRRMCVADAEDLILEWEMPGYKYPFRPRVFSEQVHRATALGYPFDSENHNTLF